MEEKQENDFLLNNNISFEVQKYIVNDIIEISLYYIAEAEADLKDIEEAILVDDIQNIYPNDNKLYIKEEEENKDLNEENDQFQFFLKESLSNKEFLSNCANKILKGERLIIEEKLRIINIHKNYKDKYSIHNLSDILGVERSTNQ